LLVGMLCLTKALIVLFVPVLAFMIIFARPHKPPGRRFLSAALIVLTAVMVVAPWSVRNFIVFKQFVPLTTHLGESFYAAYVPKDGKILGMFERDNPVHEYAVENLDEPHKSRFMFKQAVAFIKKNPKKVIKLLPLKMMFFFSPFDWEILAGQGVYSFSYMFIFPFFMLGLWHSRHKDDGIGLLRLLFFYFFFVSLLFYGSPRFRLPCEMVMIVFAAYAINRLFSKPSGFKRHILVLSAWAAANAALFIFSDNVKYLLKSILEVTGLW
jgi:4-amino-4-deoxy-L-arabinose transferase-like glycosyltransferase